MGNNKITKFSHYSHSAAVPDKSDDEFVENEYDTYEDYDTYGNASATESIEPITDAIPNGTTTPTTIATTTVVSEMLADSGTGKYKYTYKILII